MQELLEWIAPRRKAVLAFIISLLGGFIALSPDSQIGRVLGVILTALIAAGGVYQVSNKSTPS